MSGIKKSFLTKKMTCCAKHLAWQALLEKLCSNRPMLYLVTFIQSTGTSEETFMLDALLLTRGYGSLFLVKFLWPRIQMAQ